jgi:hypothetical protein
LLDDLKTRLDAEHARNVQAKRELIEKAAALANLEDTGQAVAGARDLQQAWKSVGLVPRHRDDALWSEFRGHCDAVFERSSQARAARDATLESNQARAVALCAELEQLGADESADPSGLRQRLGEVHAEFDALELPRASVRNLRRRLEAATERAEDAMRQQRLRMQREANSRVFAAHRLVRAYASAVTGSDAGAEHDALRTAAVIAVATLDPVAKEARAVLERQVAAVGARTLGLDVLHNAEALRLLCVRAELLAGLESPPEDLELRRKHQMERLVASMGRGEPHMSGTAAELLLEWLAVGSVEDSVYSAMQARFVRALDIVGD